MLFSPLTLTFLVSIWYGVTSFICCRFQTFMILIPPSPFFCYKTYFSSYCWMFISCCCIVSLCNLNSTISFFFPFFGGLVIISSYTFIITNCFIIMIWFICQLLHLVVLLLQQLLILCITKMSMIYNIFYTF